MSTHARRELDQILDEAQDVSLAQWRSASDSAKVAQERGDEAGARALRAVAAFHLSRAGRQGVERDAHRSVRRKAA